jgi:hypothetical protein
VPFICSRLALSLQIAEDPFIFDMHYKYAI